MSKEEVEDTVEEIINFVIDESRSTANSKFIIRRKKVVHKINEKEIHTEIFEDTFTIPLHKFNLNLILSQTKVHNIDETVILGRSVQRLKQNDETIEIEELKLPCDTMNLENVLPVIDFNEISSIVIKEERKQIVKNEIFKKKGETVKQVKKIKVFLFISYSYHTLFQYDSILDETKSLEPSSHKTEKPINQINKESISFVSSELENVEDTETTESIVEENLEENAMNILTPNIATETNVFTPIQEGVGLIPTEQAGSQQDFSSKSEKSKVSEEKRSSERANNISKSEGVHYEAETVSEYIDDKAKGISARSYILKTEAKEPARLFANEIGNFDKSESIKNIVIQNQVENANETETENKAKEVSQLIPVHGGIGSLSTETTGKRKDEILRPEKTKVTKVDRTTARAKNIPKTEGVHIEEETANAHLEDKPIEETVQSSKANSNCKKTASLISSEIGKVEKTEIVKPISELNQQVREKSNVLIVERKTAKAQNIPKSAGVNLEEETTETHPEDKIKGEIVGTSEIISESQESISLVPSEVGIIEESDFVEPITVQRQPVGENLNVTTVKRKMDRAKKIPKSEGVHYNEERADIHHIDKADTKSSGSSKISSDSKETVKLISKEVGITDEPEALQSFAEKTSKVTAKKGTTKSNINFVQQKSNISGVLKPPEVTEDLSDEMPVGESSKVTTVKRKMDRAKKIPKSEGVNFSEERAGIHHKDKADTKSAGSSRISSDSKETVKLISKEVGIADEPEALKNFAEQSSKVTAKKGTTKSNINIVQQTSNISGVLKYPEVTEDLSDEMPQKKSVTSIQQRGNSETATLHPTSMGVKVSEDFVEAIGEEEINEICLVPINSDVQKNVSTKIPMEVGHSIPPSSTEDFSIGPSSIEIAKVERAKTDLDLATRSERIIGIDKDGENVGNFPPDSINMEYGQSVKEKEYESYTQMSNIQGFEPVETSVGKIISSQDNNKHTAKESRARSKSIERAKRSERIIGIDNYGEDIDNFPPDSIKMEYGQSVKEKEYESYTQMSNIQGYEPVETYAEKILSSQDNCKHSAKESRARSKSTERSAQIPVSVGFNPIEKTTDICTDKSFVSQVAQIQNEEKIVERPEKISHFGGLSYDYDESELFESKPIEESNAKPKVMKIKRERASSIGRIIGFKPDEEEVNSDKITQPQEEQKADFSKFPNERDQAFCNDVTLVVSLKNYGRIRLFLKFYIYLG